MTDLVREDSHDVAQGKSMAARQSGDSAGLSARRPQKRWGIFVRKECLRLTWGGRALVGGLVLLVVYVVMVNAHPFLAETHRVNASILVIEGWIHQYALRAGANELKNGSYEHGFTTGGPESGNGGYVNDYQTCASVGAEALQKLGVPAGRIQMVPSHVNGRDRTYSSAVALKRWLNEHKLPVSSMNVLTETTHARRTRLLFQKAFGDDVKVGIISVPNPDYDAKHWWRYSDGVKDVISEGAAYVYAKFLFWPGAAKPRKVKARDQMTEDSSQTSEVKH